MARLEQLHIAVPARGSSTGGFVMWLCAFLLVGGFGGFALATWPDVMPYRATDGVEIASLAPVIATQSFATCAGGQRVTCVVDGDTFWLNGTKIRIADIDTPEVGKPSCPAEAALGRTATLRLGALLNAGAFELGAADRDEDFYGRKLRIVRRDGQSIGEILVAEGLAHPWRGHQESWC